MVLKSDIHHFMVQYTISSSSLFQKLIQGTETVSALKLCLLAILFFFDGTSIPQFAVGLVNLG